MAVDSSKIYTSVVNLFFNVSLCVAMSLCQKLYKDQLYNWYTVTCLCLCWEEALCNSESFCYLFCPKYFWGFISSAFPSLIPCRVSLLLWSSFFWSCCQAQPRLGAKSKENSAIRWERSSSGAATPKTWGSSNTTHLQGTELEMGMSTQWTGSLLVIAAPKPPIRCLS